MTRVTMVSIDEDNQWSVILNIVTIMTGIVTRSSYPATPSIDPAGDELRVEVDSVFTLTQRHKETVIVV